MPIFEIHIFSLTLAPTWYGLMYALGFFLCYEYMKRQARLRNGDIDTLLFFIFLGVILGGRFGYVFLYNASYYLGHIGEILMPWKGGMSFHGGAIGVIIAVFLFAWKHRYAVFDISDPLVTILPGALGLGRIGNLINHELLGFSAYTGPFGIIEGGVRHFPGPLLEGFLEGIILLVLMFLWKKYETRYERKPGYASAYFLLFYGIFRIFSEFFRLPDAHIGYLFGTNWVTLGMIYSLPMLLGSGIVWYYARKRGAEGR